LDENKKDKNMINDADFKALAMAAGILETAVPTARLEFPDDGSLSVTEFVESYKVAGDKPHWFPVPNPGDDLDPALIEAACGAKPSLAARAKLLKAAGADAYAQILAAWGGSPSTLVAGKNPKANGKVDDDAARDKRRKDHSTNPFSKRAWNITAQGALVKSLGLDKANAIARSVGSHVGAVRANPDY
jgi:hypothetical protein